MSAPDVAQFDRWYGVVAGSPGWRDFASEHLGLPDGIWATGFLSGDGLDEIARPLDLQPGDTLVDAGCGRGGYGLALIAGTGARLVGVDFSAVAIAGATDDAAAAGLSEHASFVVGDLACTGLANGNASAVVCVDALQFATSTSAALTECRRILQPGGRVVITTWQADPADARVPDRIRRLDLRRELVAAGFEDVDVQARPSWSATEVRLWSVAVGLPDVVDDPALAELCDEAQQLLPLADSLRRVLAVATRP